MNGVIQIINADALAALKTLPDESIQCCVTSPPYWNLRDYGVKGQIGLEETPELFVGKLTEVFREVRRVLREDGTCWVNLGDSYSSHGGMGASGRCVENLKPKDLIGIPWRVAFALQADGWYLRSDIIWAKPNCMPESVRDRPTRSHEYIFLLTKSERYFYDASAIAEPCSESTILRVNQDVEHQNGSTKAHGGAKTMKAVVKRDKQSGHSRRHQGFDGRWNNLTQSERWSGMRNKRDVWTVPPANYAGAHFATYPPDLIKPCILAGSKPGDIVLDPFGGSGTTGEVALELGRKAILIELNPEYIPLIEQRTNIIGLQL